MLKIDNSSMSSVITMISGNDALIYLWLGIEQFVLLLLCNEWSTCFVMMAIEAATARHVYSAVVKIC